LVKRKLVRIDEDKCDGCGLCVPACPEGAIQIIDGKARLVSEIYCDGLGACLGHCPKDAITIEEREAEPFDEEAVKTHLEAHRHAAAACPSAQVMQFEKPAATEPVTSEQVPAKSELAQWPIQLTLVPPQAPYLNNADLLVAADCIPFAYPNFHQDLLKGKTILIGCPKLDDVQFYIEKLAQIFSHNNIASVTVAHMEVPCCFGLTYIVKEALSSAGKDIPLEDITISIKGEKQPLPGKV
jgi:Fe-S-cluster-containing hydrogenase component 2